MRVYLVRHGQSTENVADLLQRMERDAFRSYLEDSRHATLTPLGIEQARAVALRLQAQGLTDIYASPFLRARHTAEIISAAAGPPVRIVEGLHEVIPLVPTMLRKHPRSLRSLYVRGYLSQLWPRAQGETWWSASRRAAEAWQSICGDLRPSSRVAVVSHRAFIWTLLRYLERNTGWRVVSRDMRNAGISEVRLE